MLKIFSTRQIREADRLTIQKESIPSVDLMERAAGACVDWFTSVYNQDRPVIVIAGVGNNGGDALVMARKLLEKGYDLARSRPRETYLAGRSEPSGKKGGETKAPGWKGRQEDGPVGVFSLKPGGSRKLPLPVAARVSHSRVVRGSFVVRFFYGL